MTIPSPLGGKTDLVTWSISVGGKRMPDTCRLLQLRVDKEVNRIPSAKVTLFDGDRTLETFAHSESALFVPGAEIVIRGGYDSVDSVLFSGIIVKHGVRVRADGQSCLVLSCYDKAVKLTQGRKSASLRQSDSDSMQELITGAGLAANVAATPAVHDSVVRYYASDWDFIVCRAEINGRIVVVDDARVSVAAPVCSGEPLLLVQHGQALRQIDAEIDARGQYASVECASWDFNQQQLVEASSTEPTVNPQGNLDGATLAAVFGLPAYRLHSSTPTPDGELKVWADAQLLKARLARMRGQVTFRGNARPRVGGLIRLAGLGQRFNGDAFVSRVHHRIEDGDWVTEVGFGLAPGWFSEEAAAVSGPLASGMLPGIVGLQNGVVRQIDQDPDGQTRILVDVPMVGMQGEGVWARLASGYASANAGIFFVPEIGDEVILGFVNGNPSFPIILGSLYSGRHTPPYQADAPNTNKAIVTRGQLKISMDDVKKCLVVSTHGGHSITLNDDDQSITVVDSNKNKLHLTADGIVMDSPGDITIKAGGSLTFSAASSLKLDAAQIKGTASDTMALSGMAAAKLVSSTQAVVNAPMVLIN